MKTCKIVIGKQSLGFLVSICLHAYRDCTRTNDFERPDARFLFFNILHRIRLVVFLHRILFVYFSFSPRGQDTSNEIPCVPVIKRAK